MKGREDEQVERKTSSVQMTLLAGYSRDALRFYTVQFNPMGDFPVLMERVEVAAKDLQIAWNVFSFALST